MHQQQHSYFPSVMHVAAHTVQYALHNKCLHLLCFSLQVNLDFYTRDIIRQSLHQPSPSCFVVAQRKIYSLMENGSFPRFIQSEQHRVLFDAASKQRGLGRHRKALKIRSTGDLMPRDSKPISLQSQLYLLHKD